MLERRWPWALCVLAVGCADAGRDPLVVPTVETESHLEQGRYLVRGVTLEVPYEHVLASRGISSFVGRAPQGNIAFAGPGQPPLPVFLNRRGGTYSPGNDDSRANTSIVPQTTSNVSGYSGTDAQWAQVVSCLQSMFSRFNTVMVESEPANGDYIESVIGGRPQQVGLPSGVGGVAPIDNFSCNIIPNAIVFTFSDVVGNDPQQTCEIAAQEIAHAISLDHEYHCPDPMTYLGGCGNKVFRDFNAQCGEYSPRACNCNRPTHNSVRILTEKLGANMGTPNPTPDDRQPPSINVAAPADGATLPGNSTISIEADITDNGQLATTELVWEFNNAVFPCPFNGNGGAVTCTRTGNRSTWNLNASLGERRYRIRATDVSGNSSETPPRTLRLGADGPSNNDTVNPVANITTPPNNASLSANAAIRIIARVTDETALAAVELVWSGGLNVFPCPFAGQAVSCVKDGDNYAWTLSVGVGTRRYAVRATDLAGNRFETGQQTVTLVTGETPMPGVDNVAEENDKADDAFPARCGNAIDLVVTAGDDDWFSFDTPRDTQIELSIGATSGAVITAALFAEDGVTMLSATEDIVAAGGTLTALSPGTKVLARLSTPAAGPFGYRLTAMCGGGGSNINPTDETPTNPNRNGQSATDINGDLVGGCGCDHGGNASSGASAALIVGLGLAVRFGRRRQAKR